MTNVCFRLLFSASKIWFKYHGKNLLKQEAAVSLSGSLQACKFENIFIIFQNVLDILLFEV